MKKTIIYFMGKFEIEHIQKQGRYLKAPSKKRWYIVKGDIYEENIYDEEYIYEEDNWSNKERKDGLKWRIGTLCFIGCKNIKIEFRCYKCNSVLSEKQIFEYDKKLKESNIPIICTKCNLRID